MELGVGTLTYELAGIPLMEAVDRVNKFGIKYMDLIAYSVYNPAYYSVQTQKIIAEKLKGYGMRASSITACPNDNIGADDPETREAGLELLKEAAMMVKRLGGKIVTIGAGVGNVDYDLSRKDATKNSISFVKELCRWAQKEDIYIALELEPEGLYVLNTFDAMVNMLKEVDEENCCANIDIGHFHILREKPENLAVIKDKIVHVHLSDNAGYLHVNGPIGCGNINFEWFLQTISDLGIDDNCARIGDIAVAGLEIGEPGHLIPDPDNQIHISIGNIYSRIPLLRNRKES
jgi:sugar phosphate isomerase/epimerase